VVKKAEDENQKVQLAAVSKMSFLEAELKKLTVAKKEAFAKLEPVENAKSVVEVAIAKLKSKMKILGIDRMLKDKSVKSAELAREEAQKSQNAAAITTTTQQYNEAKRAVTENEDEKGKLDAELATQTEALKAKASELQQAQADEKKFKQEYKGEEAKNKDLVKAEKEQLHKQKMSITADKEKAYSAEMVALKAKEKLAKSKRANAKVAIMKANDDIKSVKTAEDRREVEKRLADERGLLFKADKDNEDVTPPLIETARKLSATKETLHKAKSLVKKAKKTNERQNVENKLEKLENEAPQSPI